MTIGFRWTKLQDFYLRLGFLKVLVAILDSRRRSVDNETINNRLCKLLFQPAREQADLWESIREEYPWYEAQRHQAHGRHRGSRAEPSVTEALLLKGDCASQLYAVTFRTAYKIVDWGRDLGLVGAGNQISERGLLLRSLLPIELIKRFRRGDALAWNPFVVTPHDRVFFLFHLAEIDELTLRLIDDLAGRDPSITIESSDAAAVTCRALFRVLDAADGTIAPRELPALRKARQLACAMAQELDLTDLVEKCGPLLRERLPKPKKIDGRKSPLASRRRTTKNADHQTIPRFEQLVDLGFLSKPVVEPRDQRNNFDARRRWRYCPTPICAVWSEAKGKWLANGEPWEWYSFAAIATSALITGKLVSTPDVPDRQLIGQYLWEAYENICRPVGYTPFHSVAMLAMINSVVDGMAIEMATFHNLMLKLKKNSLLANHAFFASGNDLGKMFVLLRPNFLEALEQIRDPPSEDPMP